MTSLLDTNVLVRHLTGDPPELAARAGRFLGAADDLLLPDLILAEVAYVLQSFYWVPRSEVAALLRDVLAFEPVRVADPGLLSRTVDLYDADRLGLRGRVSRRLCRAVGRRDDRLIRPLDRPCRVGAPDRAGVTDGTSGPRTTRPAG